MIAMIDYDAGNIKSVEKALTALGETVVITRDKDTLLHADKVILPGVGAFGDAMAKLRKYELEPVIHEIVEQQTPFMGICLGLQLLFESSEEAPEVAGNPQRAYYQNTREHGIEGASDWMEFFKVSESRQALSGDCRGFVCIFCAFVLFTG